MSRAEGAPSSDIPPDEFGHLVFFQMWAARADPFKVLEEGDTLWWVDQRSRQGRWELRVRNLHSSQYSTIATALARLRQWFGLFPGDLNSYAKHAREHGWLLAWENEVVGACSVTLPREVKLGRNGLRRISFDDARAAGLPEPGRPAALTVEPMRQVPLFAPARERAIPAPVRRAVFERDGRRCTKCGQVNGAFHVDHIHPWSSRSHPSVEQRWTSRAREPARAVRSVQPPQVRETRESTDSVGSCRGFARERRGGGRKPDADHSWRAE